MFSLQVFIFLTHIRLGLLVKNYKIPKYTYNWFADIYLTFTKNVLSYKRHINME